MGGSVRNSGDRSRKAPTTHRSQTTNIVKTAVRIIAGWDARGVSLAAEAIGVSEPTLYRWQRAGSMREARGAKVLRVHELTGLPLEMLLRG